MTRIAIIIGSTRPGRLGPAVAEWVATAAGKHESVIAGTASVEIVDLAEYRLPLLDEAESPMSGQYGQPHTLAWAATIKKFDGFIFVTPEYNHSVPGALKNAIDFLFAEWNHKAAGFVSYGGHGGTRAVEHLRTIMAELKTATVRSQVALSVASDLELFTDTSSWSPNEYQTADLSSMLTEVIEWADALKPLRETTDSAV